jgi:hypothetical protein
MLPITTNAGGRIAQAGQWIQRNPMQTIKQAGAGLLGVATGYRPSQPSNAAKIIYNPKPSQGFLDIKNRIHGTLSRLDKEQIDLENFLNAGAAAAAADAAARGGGGGGGYVMPAPLRLPRMAMPSPEEIAAQLYAAVGAATTPFDNAIGQLGGQRNQNEQSILQADRDARTSMSQTTQDWRTQTAGISNQIADVYRVALTGLNDMLNSNNRAMMNAGFAPANNGGSAALGRLSGLGAAAQEASLARRDAGEATVRDMNFGRGQVTQAGRQTLASSYAQVLGSLNLQKAAAEAAARAEQVNQQAAIRREIERINFEAASQEAAANR